MIFRVQNGQLVSDLDCQFYNLLNVGGILPVPSGFVTTDDPRLSDPRVPLDGSVTNIKVSATAGIVQSKLSLDGVIPPAWLGTTGSTAATGSLAEYVSRKGAANGYASLDGTGKVPLAQLPALAGVGTVTSVGLSTPAGLSVAGSPITTSGTLALSWAAVGGNTWFGNPSASNAVPAFQTGPLPMSAIPNIDAAKVTSGVLNPAQLPTAVGVGPSHAKGAVPDPGATGDVNQYLARDMTYKYTPTSAKVDVIITAGAGTFTSDPLARVLLIECWGGGGGGGGAVASTGTLACASGGGGGGYVQKTVSNTQSVWNYTVGGGGSGGNATGANGGPGIDTDWYVAGSPVAIGRGGFGGNGSPTGGTTPGIVRPGASGGGSAGDFGMTGGDGGDSIRWDGVTGKGGDGGDAAMGGGGAKGASAAADGLPGNQFGGGGSGALSISATGHLGGVGAIGAIRITQIF